MIIKITLIDDIPNSINRDQVNNFAIVYIYIY